MYKKINLNNVQNNVYKINIQFLVIDNIVLNNAHKNINIMILVIVMINVHKIIYLIKMNMNAQIIV